MPAPKHRGPGRPIERGWTRWPRHRDGSVIGPAPEDGMTEYQAKWVAAMKVREVENHRRRQAVWS